jgi:alginate O-acetyltransferase complex protein AlgI
MVFSSIAFLLYFLPFFLLIYYACPDKIKNYFLLLASILFYSWGAPKFIFVILGTTVLDFFLVHLMDNAVDERKRKFLLVLSVCMNLGLLVYFKYCNFFIDNINALLPSGVLPIHLLNVTLPIGISFYTFESLTYVVDVYRREHKPLTSFLDYQLYIILFPKLIAGPIIRYHEIADQINGRFETFNYNQALKGFHRFIIGLSKKVIIANSLGEYADLVFGTDVNGLSSGIAWLGALCYTMQIYFDFSGYSDMAIGLAQMMGFRFPENFNNPYTSGSITEFWRRWHMTLGAWMRNYLYIPLGGNRVNSKLKLYFNLWIVFVLSGFWHGASWTFIFWGVFHGTFLILERTKYGKLLEALGKWPAMLITFLIVNFSWIFFREESLQGAFGFIHSMFEFHRPQTIIDYNLSKLYVYLGIAFFFSFFNAFPLLQKIQEKVYFTELTALRSIFYTVISILLLGVCIGLITSSTFNPFIYFRF